MLASEPAGPLSKRTSGRWVACQRYKLSSCGLYVRKGHDGAAFGEAHQFGSTAVVEGDDGETACCGLDANQGERIFSSWQYERIGCRKPRQQVGLVRQKRHQRIQARLSH